MKKILIFILLFFSVASAQNTLVRRAELGDSTNAVRVDIGDSLDIRLGDNWITPQMYGAVGDGTTDDASAFSTIVALTDTLTLYIPKGEYNLGSLITFPQNIYLVFANGAILLDSVVINGSITAGLYKIFDSGVDLNNARVKEAYPQWWGGMPDAIIDIETAGATITTNNTLPIYKAIYSGAPVYLTEGTWGANLHLKDSIITILGAGKRQTILASYSGAYPVLWIHSDVTGGQIQGVRVENIGIYGNDAVVGLQLEALTPYIVSEGTFRNLTIGHTTYGIKTISPNTEIYQNLFENIEIYKSSVDGLLTGLGVYNKYRNLQITGSDQYAINATDISSEFTAIQTDGQIISIGQNCIFRNINIEDIYTTSPPTSYAMNIAGRNSVIDKINFTNVPSTKCTVGLELGNDNQSIKNIRSWGTLTPNYLLELGGSFSGTLENLDAGNDTVYNPQFENRLDNCVWIDDPRDVFLDSLVFASDAKLTSAAGAELITNTEDREFTTTTGNWDVSSVTGATLASIGGQLIATQSGTGEAIASLINTHVTDTLVVGRSYEVRFDLIDIVGFTNLNLRVFGVGQQATYILADTGTVIYKVEYNAGVAWDRLTLWGDCVAGGSFTIDNISVKPLDKLKFSAYNGFEFYKLEGGDINPDVEIGTSGIVINKDLTVTGTTTLTDLTTGTTLSLTGDLELQNGRVDLPTHDNMSLDSLANRVAKMDTMLLAFGIANPTGSNDVSTAIFVDRGITLDTVFVVLRTSAETNDDVDINIRWASNIQGSISNAFTSDVTVSDSTTGIALVPNTTSISARSWIWLECTSETNTVNQINATIKGKNVYP